MKKIYNFLLVILIIAAIVVGILIAIKYGKNHINETEIAKTLSEIDEMFMTNEESGVEIEMEYKGHKVVGIIEIPKINIRYPIINETSDELMKISVTKFWGPDINEIGNFTIAGHNNRDGTMFGKTKYLQKGDIIKLTSLKNESVTYKIFDIYSIDPSDVSCVESVDGKTKEVTLITCTNGHKQRLIVKAREIK